jgi:hypothetical protein
MQYIFLFFFDLFCVPEWAGQTASDTAIISFRVSPGRRDTNRLPKRQLISMKGEVKTIIRTDDFTAWGNGALLRLALDRTPNEVTQGWSTF